MTKKTINISMKEPSKPAIFNPLNHLAATASADTPANRFASLSTIINTDVGICPKCKLPMGQAVLANNDTVFYCDADRVSSPLPNSEG